MEKQRRIEKNAIDYMAYEYKKAEGNVSEGKKRYSLNKMGVFMRIVFLLLPGIYCLISLVGGMVINLYDIGDVYDRVALCVAAVVTFLFFYFFWFTSRKAGQEVKLMNGMAVILKEKGEHDKEVLNENFMIIKRAYNETVGALKELYAVDVIYPKYRSLEACGMFLEYLMAGRTSSLEASGTDQGAYNIYENELFKGIIINKLDQVLSNQRLLIEGQKYISKQTETVIGGLNEVRKLTEDIKTSAQISAFCNTVTAYNTSVTRKIAEQKYYR